MSSYDCKNRPDTRDLPGYYAQDGQAEDGSRRMSWIRTQWLEIACGYSERKSDSRCDGCRWRFA